MRPPDAELVLRVGARPDGDSPHGLWLLVVSKDEQYISRVRRPDHDACLVCLCDSGDLVGVFNFNDIIRGAFQNAFLGFYAFTPYAGKGLMSEGIQLVFRYAFSTLRLHRLEANTQPGNMASVALVHRCGFVREGFSRAYLRVSGRWCDHERWAITAEEWRHLRGSLLRAH